MKRTNRILSMLLAVIMVVCMLPVSVFAADAATIVVNSEVIRYSDSKAEVSFYPTSYDSQSDWQYYYIVSQQDESKTADDVKNGGTAYEFDENVGVATFDVTELAEGVKYIHIVLVQKNDPTQASNVLKLIIPEYVPLTLVPSADGCELDGNNTITVAVGTIVTFTTSESGCGMEYKEGTTVGPDLEFVGDEGYIRTATFSEIGTYTIEASINYKTAECTVIVVEEIHQHSYSSEWTKDDVGHWHACECGDMTDYADHTSSGAATEDEAEVCTVCGYEISPKLTVYTITPSAEGGSYDASTNTLTIVGGGTVNLTLNVSGSVRFYDNGEFTMTPVNGTADSATEWTTNLPNTNKTYHFYHNLSDLQAECIVIVKKACALTLVMGNETIGGDIAGLSPVTVSNIASGTVVNLADYWPSTMEYTVNGQTYYFTEFWEHETGGNIVRSVTISDDLTVYAGWTTEKQITITFDPNGGSMSHVKQRESTDCEISVINDQRKPTRNGYEFVGWSLENDGTADDGDIILTEDCTLYAVWKVNSLSAPTGLHWDTSNGTVAVWDAVDGATNYIVELYKKDIITLHLLSHVVSDTSFDYDLTSLSPGSYYFTVRATFDDIKSESATSNNVLTTSGGTPILINGSSERVDYIDGTAFVVGREDIADGSISEVDMSGVSGSTNLVIDPSKIDPNADKVTVKFDGTQAEMNNDALQKILDNLGDGDNVKISVKDVGAEVLPDSLTEEGAYGGIKAAIDKSIFKATGIENIEDRLKTLGLINGNTDSSVTEDEFEYLYHYLTTDELTALKNELNESAHFEHHQNAVNWLTEMIERDNTALPFTYNNLLDYADFTDEQIAVLTRPGGISGSDYPALGELREIGLTLEQMQLLQGNAKALREDEASTEVQAKYDALLDWLDDAIAQRELEASYEQMDEWIAGLSITDDGGKALDDAKLAAESMTTAELERFLENARKTNMMASSLALGDLISFLEDELEAREASDTHTYINTSGTSDGINPIFIGAVDVNIGAVKADGTTTPIAIKADRSDAFAWSTTVHVPKLLLEAPEWNTENIRAYKVLDNGTLEAKASKVIVNADGTLTLSAMSDGNSTYVFLYEPAKADIDDNTNTDVPSSPQTGDNSHMWLWVALLFVSGAGLAGTTIYGRKRRTN